MGLKLARRNLVSSLLACTCLALIGCANNTDILHKKTPDLIVSAATVSGTPIAGASITIGDTTTNTGGSTAPATSTQFYLNTTAVKGGTLLGTRAISSLAAGAASAGSTSVTLPSNINGAYYLIACADDTGSSFEKSFTNNCTSASITIQAPILTESGVSVSGALASGGSITISETTKNTGGASAPASSTRFYLNTSAVKGGTPLGTRAVPTLAAGAASSGSTSVTLPSNINGAYYVVACADDDGSKCASAAITVAGADLAERGMIPAAGIAGQTLQVSDTVTNLAGAGSAGTSSTRFYLNTSAAKGGTLLTSRSVPALAAGTASTGATMLILPATANGQNYLIVCANDTGSVVESNSANNCLISPLQVVQPANAILVNSSAPTAADGPTCGATIAGVTNAPCKTIAGGIAAATGNSVSGVFLAEGSTYSEQVTISNQLTLGALGSGATLQALPVPLTADSDGLESFITVKSGASAVITNLTIQGPVKNTSCSERSYGIYVKSANATVAANRILNIATDNPAGLFGCQSGIGIRAGAGAFGYVATGSIYSNIINGYQKGGIVVDGPGTNVSVTGNFVTGNPAAYAVTAQNGIQISRGAIGTVSDNVVSGNSFGNNYCSGTATGFLLYNLAPGLTVINNQVTGNDEGIAFSSDSSTVTNAVIKNNAVFNNLLLGIKIDANSTGNKVWLNRVYGNATYDEVDETGSFTSLNDWGINNPSNANILGPSGNGVYTQHAGPLCP